MSAPSCSMVVDRNVKIPLYCRAGITEVWIVDLNAECVETFRAPSADRYEERHILAPEDHIAPELLPDVSIL